MNKNYVFLYGTFFFYNKDKERYLSKRYMTALTNLKDFKNFISQEEVSNYFHDCINNHEAPENIAYKFSTFPIIVKYFLR